MASTPSVAPGVSTSGAQVSRTRGFQDVSYDEALARAESLVPLLRASADASEKMRAITPAALDALHESGLLRMHQPKYWGGMELDFLAHFDVPDILGRGDASASWTFANLASHHRQLAQWPMRAQEEVLGPDPDALIASGIAYIQGRGTLVEGGLVLTGQWGFSSGVTVSGWCMLACMVKNAEVTQDWCMCLVPAEDYEIIDDWQTSGMRGTGSCSVKCDAVFVPQHRVLSMKADVADRTCPGLLVHQNPLFRISAAALSQNGIAGTLIGNAQAIVDASIDFVKDRSTSYSAAKMRDFATVQLRIATAAAKIDAARVWLRNDCREGTELAKAGHAIDTERRLRYRRNTAMAIRIVNEAVALLQEMAGANGIYDRFPIQRMFRDAAAASGHIVFSTDAQLTPWGLLALGGEVKLPTV
jgi:3-hydroxy-9,10-secoandrosta-1,3,5(10)-triene-9,17-dione monooxygenase